MLIIGKLKPTYTDPYGMENLVAGVEDPTDLILPCAVSAKEGRAYQLQAIGILSLRARVRSSIGTAIYSRGRTRPVELPRKCMTVKRCNRCG